MFVESFLRGDYVICSRGWYLSFKYCENIYRFDGWYKCIRETSVQAFNYSFDRMQFIYEIMDN